MAVEPAVVDKLEFKKKNKSQMLRTIRLLAFSLAIFILGLGSGYFLRASGIALRFFPEGKPSITIVNRNSGPSEIDFSLFWEVWDKLHNEYLDLDKLDNAKMVYGAISGMTAAIGDPYTVFLPPTDNKRAKEDLDGAFEGVGIQLGFIERQLAVISPLEGHPAKAQGIRASDLILKIKDEAKEVDTDTQGMSLPEAVQIIRGKKGTPVTLTVLHEGADETVEITIVRDTIVVPSVELEFGRVEGSPDGEASGLWKADEAAGEIAWLRVFRFGDRTESQWDDAVGKILTAKRDRAGFKGVVLDLRNNPGGFLTGSVYLASEFIADGVIVSQQGKFSSSPFEVERNGKLIGLPLVVLINKGSASASEIVAGALRDRLGVKLVGETSFGKGTVQDAQDLRQGAGIHITTGRWLLPSGEWISDEGLTPDVLVELEEVGDEEFPEDSRKDAQLEKAVEVLGEG